MAAASIYIDRLGLCADTVAVSSILPVVFLHTSMLQCLTVSFHALIAGCVCAQVLGFRPAHIMDISRVLFVAALVLLQLQGESGAISLQLQRFNCRLHCHKLVVLVGKGLFEVLVQQQSD